MKLRPILRLLINGAFVSVALGAPLEPSDHVVFFDPTGSVSASDRARWADVADEKVGKFLRPGDTLSLYAIGSNTTERAPVLEISIPAGKGLAEDLKARRTRQALRDAIRSLMNAPGDSQSNIIGAFERLHPMPGRKMVVLILSDCIQSMPGIDFERLNLRLHGARIIDTVLKEYRWMPGRLAGTVIDIVLDSPVARHRGNSHVDLRAFYDTLIRRLGGELRWFDSARGLTLQSASLGGAR